MAETEKELLLRVAFQANFAAGLADKAGVSSINIPLSPDEARTISRVLREAAEGWNLQEENARLRQHIAYIHNRVRHELSAEIQAASDKAFEAMAGTKVLRPLPPPPTEAATQSLETSHD